MALISDIRQSEVFNANQTDAKHDHMFILFVVWSFITLCRPQDYLSFLGIMRPSLSLGLVTFVLFILNGGNFRPIIKTEQFKLLLFLIGLMLIGIPFSSYKTATLLEVINYTSVSLIFFTLFYGTLNTTKQLKTVMFVYCCGVSIYGIQALIFGRILLERISFGSMFDPNDLAFFIINFLAFNLLFINKGYRFKRVIAIMNFIIGLVVLFKTGSRGGFLACLTLLAYLLIFKTTTINISIFIKAVIVSFTLVLLFSFSVNTERYKSILNIGTDYNVTGETGRVAIWKTGIRLMLSNPIVGLGIGRFNAGVGNDRKERGLPSARWQTAHNSFVQIGAETGVIGLLLFTLMSYKVFSITSHVVANSRSEELVKIAEMTRVGFIGHLVCAVFLSQAYSIYWLFYIICSAKIYNMSEKLCGTK